MIISKCHKSDLPAIRYLMLQYGNKMIVEETHLNKKDIALQARLESGELIGFLWCGLMANNTIAYMDKVAVDPAHTGNGVINALYIELFRIAYKKGVRTVIGFVRQDEYHLKSCKAALKMGLGGDAISYTHVYADLNFMKSELGIEV